MSVTRIALPSTSSTLHPLPDLIYIGFILHPDTTAPPPPPAPHLPAFPQAPWACVQERPHPFLFSPNEPQLSHMSIPRFCCRANPDTACPPPPAPPFHKTLYNPPAYVSASTSGSCWNGPSWDDPTHNAQQAAYMQPLPHLNNTCMHTYPASSFTHNPQPTCQHLCQHLWFVSEWPQL